MSSKKGSTRRLRDREITLPVAKGSKPMTRDEINKYFAANRDLRAAEAAAKANR